MSNTLRKELEKAVQTHKNEPVVFERAPKKMIRAAVKDVMHSHKRTITELADR